MILCMLWNPNDSDIIPDLEPQFGQVVGWSEYINISKLLSIKYYVLC